MCRLTALDTCYDRGAPLFFSILPLNLGALRPLPKTDLDKNKTCFIADEQSHGLGTRRESRKKKMAYFRRFWVKSPFIQKPFQVDENCYLYPRVCSVKGSKCVLYMNRLNSTGWLTPPPNDSGGSQTRRYPDARRSKSLSATGEWPVITWTKKEGGFPQ